MPKTKTPSHNGERFDALLQNIAAAVGNDAELAALQEIANALWQLLTPEQKTAFFDSVIPLETKAARWTTDSDSRPPRSSRVSGRTEALTRACESLLEEFLEEGDLNDLPASDVIDMLEQALGRKHGKGYSADTENIATNAARIAHSFDWGVELSPSLLDKVVAAAAAMDRIEAQPDFTWETQSSDWETVCADLSDAILVRRVKSWPREIQRLLQ